MDKTNLVARTSKVIFADRHRMNDKLQPSNSEAKLLGTAQREKYSLWGCCYGPEVKPPVSILSFGVFPDSVKCIRVIVYKVDST